MAIRRPGNKALPTLEAKPQHQHQKKSSVHAHDGGVVASIGNIPEEQSWAQIKETVKEKLPAKVSIWFVSEVSDKNQCIVATSPFDADVQFFEELKLELAGTIVKCEVAHGELLQQSLKLMPKHIRDKRERESRKRQRDRNRPIIIGTQKFVNVGALKGRVKEILNSRSDGESLKPDGSDFKLIKGLLGFHPKGAEKSKDMVGIKVQKSTQGESRCFFMVKSDGKEEDFSAKKCLDAVEANPPYVQNEPKAKAEAKAMPEAKAASAGSEAKPESKAEAASAGSEAKPEAKAEVATTGPEAKPEAKAEAAPTGPDAKPEAK